MNSSHNISDNCRVNRHLPSNWIVFSGFTITIYVTVVNVLLVFIFLQKKNLSSVSILLAALALTDAFTSIGIFIPDFTVYTFTEVTFTEENMKYPFCLVYLVSLYSSNIFHLMSVVTTTILCTQKACVISFPIWSRQHIHISFSYISIGVTSIISMFLYFPRILKASLYLYPNQTGLCCAKFSTRFDFWIKISSWGVTFVYACAIFIMVTGALYISCKLTILKKTFEGNTVTRARNKRSALLVVIICIIFICSESINYLMWLQRTFSFSFSRFFQVTIAPYSYLLMTFGFSLNFEVYLIMSQNMRKMICECFKKLFKKK